MHRDVYIVFAMLGGVGLCVEYARVHVRIDIVATVIVAHVLAVQRDVDHTAAPALLRQHAAGRRVARRTMW